jgi:beta-lactam-binding protein with PASTA domain
MTFRIIIGEGRIRTVLRKCVIAGIWIFGGGALVLTVFGLSFYFAMRVEMSSTEVKVPDLSGLTLEGASQRVAPLELVLTVVEHRHDPAVPSDRVLQQVPQAGSSVRRGRKVKVVISLGEAVLQIPNLVGEAARTVGIGLERSGLTPGYEVRVHNGNIPAGTVLAQAPPADTPAVPNTRVHRLVSEGPVRTTWVMPDLRGWDRPHAETGLKKAGFRVAVRRVRISGRTSGNVLGQLPLAGYPVRKSDIIELTVAD